MALSTADQYYLKALDHYPCNLEQTMESLNYALSYQPEHADSLYLTGRVYLEQVWDHTLARQYFQAALAARPEHGLSCFWFARMEIDSGRFDHAEKLLQHARKLPELPTDRLFQMEASIAEGRKDYPLAKTLIKRARMESANTYFRNELDNDLSRIKEKLKGGKKKRKKKKSKKKNK